jgi:NAD(P)H-hydrate epimerase
MKKTGLITLEYVNTVIKERKRDIHKGDCGKVLVIAGSKGMAGAAVLCGRAAYKAGAGLVRVAIDEKLYPIIQTALPEATCVSRKLSKSGLKDYDAIAIGPGLGDDAENEKLIEYILKNYDKTVVLDADGLNALAKTEKAHTLKKTPAKVIITPHMGEAKRLISKERREKEWPAGDVISEKDRLKVTEMLMDETEAIVVLKGAGTLVASKAGGTYTNTTGNPGMATGGSGDVLTGIIAALAGQTKSPWDSAKAGVFIHGKAGDMAAEAVGEYGMSAMDIAEMTAFVLKKLAD